MPLVNLPRVSRRKGDCILLLAIFHFPIVIIIFACLPASAPGMSENGIFAEISESLLVNYAIFPVNLGYRVVTVVWSVSDRRLIY